MSVHTIGKSIKQQKQTKNDFLQRFEGRTSSIGKSGLIALLQKNVSPSYQQQNPSLQKYAMKSKILPYKNPQQIERRTSHLRIDIKDHRSSNQSFRTDLPKKSKIEPASQKKSSIPKLPSIGSPRYQSVEKPSIDKNTRKHLQYLNMFEQRLKHKLK